MFPEDFIKRLNTQEYIDSDKLLKALGEPSPDSIRINPSKWNRIPENSDRIPWCKWGYYLKERPSYTLDPLFHAGCYYPQEASSMFIEQVFRQVIGNNHDYLRVLDLCGAPGGKSTHIASLLGEKGILISNDAIRSRARILAENLARWGISNVIVTQNDPGSFSNISGFFDIIIADAPCSGEGMFRDPVAVREWSKENARHCADRQKRILADVWPSLKENGILIYSTCTFNPAENEENINWLVSRYPVETVDLEIRDFRGIIEIDFKGTRSYSFYPDRIKGDGFFISVLRKKQESAGKSFRLIRKKENEPKKDDIEIVRNWTNFNTENIIRKADMIIAVPGRSNDYQLLDQRLNVIREGTRICSAKKNGYVPDHELAVSDSLKEDVFGLSFLDLRESLLYLRREKLSDMDFPEGWFIVNYMGKNLGFCNNVGNRVNNYYPMEWRIRMPLPDLSDIITITWGD